MFSNRTESHESRILKFPVRRVDEALDYFREERKYGRAGIELLKHSVNQVQGLSSARFGQQGVHLGVWKPPIIQDEGVRDEALHRGLQRPPAHKGAHNQSGRRHVDQTDYQLPKYCLDRGLKFVEFRGLTEDSYVGV